MHTRHLVIGLVLLLPYGGAVSLGLAQSAPLPGPTSSGTPTPPPLVTTPFGPGANLAIFQQHIQQFQTMATVGLLPTTATARQTIEAQQAQRLNECIAPEALTEISDSLEKDFAGASAAVQQTMNAIPVSRLVASKLEEKEYDLRKNWTVGTAAAAKLFSYDLARKSGAIADGLGVGAPFRWYGKTKIHAIERKCRTSAYSNPPLNQDPRTGTLGDSPVFAITPTIYFSKTAESSDVAIQPALVMSFLYDTLHFGTGFHLSGPSQGNVFLLFGIGTQLPFESK